MQKKLSWAFWLSFFYCPHSFSSTVCFCLHLSILNTPLKPFTGSLFPSTPGLSSPLCVASLDTFYFKFQGLPHLPSSFYPVSAYLVLKAQSMSSLYHEDYSAYFKTYPSYFSLHPNWNKQVLMYPLDANAYFITGSMCIKKQSFGPSFSII